MLSDAENYTYQVPVLSPCMVALVLIPMVWIGIRTKERGNDMITRRVKRTVSMAFLGKYLIRSVRSTFSRLYSRLGNDVKNLSFKSNLSSTQPLRLFVHRIYASK